MPWYLSRAFLWSQHQRRQVQGPLITTLGEAKNLGLWRVAPPPDFALTPKMTFCRSYLNHRTKGQNTPESW